MAEAVFLVEMSAPPSRVIEALSTLGGLTSWWTPDIGGSASEGAEMSLGFPDAPARFALEVDEAGDAVVQWTSVGAFPPHWTGTKIRFTLMPGDDGGTRLFFEHTGFAAADPALGHTAFTWANLMNSLKTHVESGRAAPFFVV